MKKEQYLEITANDRLCSSEYVPKFCSSFTRLLVLQPKLSVTTSGCGEREQNCAVLTTAKKTGKSGHVIGDICH